MKKSKEEKEAIYVTTVNLLTESLRVAGQKHGTDIDTALACLALGVYSSPKCLKDFILGEE